MNYGQGVLFVDDDRNRAVKVLGAFPMTTWVQTARDAIESLKTRDYSTVFLDYDLTTSEKGDDFSDPESGMEIVRFIKDAKPKIDSVCIHSHNASAAAQMMIELKLAGYDAVYSPFGRTRFWQEKLR